MVASVSRIIIYQLLLSYEILAALAAYGLFKVKFEDAYNREERVKKYLKFSYRTGFRNIFLIALGFIFMFSNHNYTSVLLFFPSFLFVILMIISHYYSQIWIPKNTGDIPNKYYSWLIRLSSVDIFRASLVALLTYYTVEEYAYVFQLFLPLGIGLIAISVYASVYLHHKRRSISYILFKSLLKDGVDNLSR